MTSTNRVLIASSLILLLGTLSSSASVLFSDDFDGTGDLNDTTPDTTIGSTAWVAADTYSATGSHTGRGSATLAFTPVDGTVYQAETWISASSGDFWVGMGFANGESTGNTVNDVFTGSDVEGRAWMLLRMPDVTDNNNATFLTSNANGADWTSFGDTRGAVGMRIDLDTTGGAGNWTATYYAKENQGDAWTMVRAATTLTDEDITSVGFSAFRSNSNFTTGSFTLTQVPEPSTYALVLVTLVGGVVFLRHRRK